METMVVGGQNKPKRLKVQEILEGREEDRISALPESLLLEILSRLPSTKDAITTGPLSKRWKHLWTLVPSLYFTDYIGPWFDFISCIDKTLNQCRQLKLKKFVLHIGYDIKFQSQVNNWIRYAIKCNVEELNLMLWNTEPKAKFVLDQFFFISSCFTDLTLEGCILNPTGAISWKNLRSLCIYDGKLNEDLIENILSGSPLLETLILNDCYGYKCLNITSKSVKKLVFSGYSNPEGEFEADIIEINAPHILSLTIQDELLLWKLLLVNVSSLVEGYLDYKKNGHSEGNRKEEEEEMLKGFMLNLRHVKELKIGSFCSEVLSRLEDKGFDFPSNIMKFLHVTYDWFHSDACDSDSDSDGESVDSEDFMMLWVDV